MNDNFIWKFVGLYTDKFRVGEILVTSQFSRKSGKGKTFVDSVVIVELMVRALWGITSLRTFSPFIATTCWNQLFFICNVCNVTVN